MFFMILQKLHIWQESGSSWPKMLSTNQFAVFFDHQYLLKESISLLNFYVEISAKGR